MKLDADFHIHGKHSGGVSPDMEIPVLDEEAAKKGLDLVGTGDILNPKWLSHVEETTEKHEGFLLHEETMFVPTTEVEDENRVHHVLVFPSLEHARSAYEDFRQYSDDIRKEGRPRIRSDGEKIVELAKKNDALIGPAHAFTPYTALYGKHDSLEGSYGEQVDRIDFLELGLSADSSMAKQISAHEDLKFLSNSDAHSPWPHRIGREFNRLELGEKTFSALERLFQGKKGEIKMNVGLDPREGKYHCSACNSCHQKYTLQQARENSWKCRECSGKIKKGVKDRVEELSDTPGGERPKYLKLPPFANIIQEVVGHSSPTTKKVQKTWKRFNDIHGSEIEILIEEDIEKLKKTDARIGEAIRKFREGETLMVPGGGGDYGELVIPSSREEKRKIEKRRKAELECRYENTQTDLQSF